jgi:Flp pilus assembly pilin Flp
MTHDNGSWPTNLQQSINRIHHFIHNQKGQGLIEYGLIISFVVLVGMVGVSVFGTDLNTMVTNISAQIPSPP